MIVSVKMADNKTLTMEATDFMVVEGYLTVHNRHPVAAFAPGEWLSITPSPDSLKPVEQAA